MDSPYSSMSTPGCQALLTAKNTPDLVVFKKPTDRAVKSKRSKSKILDEDTYIKEVGEIIERDFFPYLKNLKVQNEYLDALEQNNVIRMRQVYEKYSSDRPTTERVASPATFETPFRENIDASRTDEPGKSPRNMTASKNCDNETKTGLDTYLCTHTSEDNASFEEMMEETEQRQRIKYSWLYEEESKNQSIEGERTNLAIGCRNEKESMKVKQFAPDSWGYRNKNFIMYVPDGVQLTSNEKIEMAKRKREVRHENTRLMINPFNEKQNKETISEMAKTQLKSNDGKIGVDGKEVIKNPTPKINGFSFFATPSPRPGEYDSPLMTWGQIEGTPFRLDNGNTPLIRTNQGPSFRMAEPPKREKLAMQLAEKAGERHRDRKNKALEAARKSLAT